MIKKILLLILGIILVTSLTGNAFSPNMLHNHSFGTLATSATATGEYVGRMNPDNKVFFDHREQALDDGYRPCKVCNP